KELEQLVEEQKTGKLSDERRVQLLRKKLSNKWASGNRSAVGKSPNAQLSRFLVIGAVLAGLVWLFFNWV
ncbi:hypothetical protein ACFLR1_04540, partial [Bacteroidota bacterium]